MPSGASLANGIGDEFTVNLGELSGIVFHKACASDDITTP